MLVQWAQAKRGMGAALQGAMRTPELRPGDMRARLEQILVLFLEAGVAHGDLRSDVTNEDAAALLVGALSAAPLEDPDRTGRILRLATDALTNHG